MKDRIKARCERIEKELDAIKQEAIKQEFTLEEWTSFNEIQGYTAAKWPQIRRYARRTIP
jgi:hypothetical protein